LREREGCNLFELAANNPTDAYIFLRGAIGNTAFDNAFGVSVDGEQLFECSCIREVTFNDLGEEAILKYLPLPCTVHSALTLVS